MLPTVSVVVPTFRNPAGVAVLLRALADGGPAPHEVFVVDNGGDEAAHMALAAAVAAAGVPTRLLRIEVNAGPARARNLGWQAATGDVVAYLDDDVVPSPGWVGAIADAFGADDVGVVQGRTTPPAGTDPERLAPWTVVRDVDGPTPWFEACNLAFRRAAIEATGGFDEAMGFYGEDTAAGWAVRESGWRHDFAPSAHVVHGVEARGLGWFLRHAARERNLVTVAVRHPSFRAGAAWRHWALRPDEPLVGLAWLGAVAVATGRRRLGVALAAPYLWRQRRFLRFPHRWRLGAEHVAHDTVRLAAHVAGSVEQRTLLL